MSYGIANGLRTWITSSRTITRAQLIQKGFDLSDTGDPIFFGFQTRHSAVNASNRILIDDVKVTYTTNQNTNTTTTPPTTNTSVCTACKNIRGGTGTYCMPDGRVFGP